MSRPIQQPEDARVDSNRLDNVLRLTRGYVDDGKLPGTITIVARHGAVVLNDCYGRRDVERDLPIESDTVFRIYSMTKPIVSVALMTLYEQGAFQLDDPAATYLPSLHDVAVFDGGTAERYSTRPASRPITVRDLLTHLSGLAGRGAAEPIGELYRRRGIADVDGDLDLADTVERLGSVPLACDPGTQWIYGISTDLVGRLCEVLSGRPLDRFLADMIFDPLGMVDTGFHVADGAADRFAALYGPSQGAPGYDLLDDPRTSRYLSPRPYLSGSSGLVSTGADYLRFASMLLNGGELDGARVLGPRTVALMSINHLPGGADLSEVAQHGGETQRAGQGFGLGFAVLLDQARAQLIGTPGEIFWAGAASTAFFVNPAEQLVTIFLTQLRPSATYLRLRRELRATIYSALLD